MMPPKPLPGIGDCAARLRAGGLTIPELAERCLDAVAAGNDRLHAIVAHDPYAVRADAADLQARLEQGEDRGPLHGIPIVVKDTIRVAGLPVCYGSAALAERPARIDATAVARLRAAGALVLGKATTWELGCGVGEFHPSNPFPEALNPVDPRYFAGGSSNGSAVAVAAGFACGAIGGDTGGSIRLPAAACGVVGLKPSFGLIDRDGALAHSSSLDHLGAFAIDPNGALLIVEAMAGLPAQEPAPVALRGLRVGLLDDCLDPAGGTDPAICEAMERLAGRLAEDGAALARLKLGSPPERWRRVMETIGGFESLRANRRLAGLDGAQLSRPIRDWWQRAAAIGEESYEAALSEREVLAARLQFAFQKTEVLLSPTAALPVPLVTDEAARIRYSTTSALAVFNLSGHPAISVPLGRDALGLPLGLQICAARGAERLLTAVATAILAVCDTQKASAAPTLVA